VSHSVDDAEQRARYWPVPVLRAVPAAVIAMVITFSPNHSAGFGLVLFGVFALVDGAVLAWGSAARLPGDDRSRRSGLVQAALSIVAGIAALACTGLGLPAFITLVVAFALLTGALELSQGVRARRRSPFARDWTTIGGLTLRDPRRTDRPGRAPRRLPRHRGGLPPDRRPLAQVGNGCPGGHPGRSTTRMSTSTRRDRMRPAELLGISAVIAVVVGLVVLMSTRELTLSLVFLGVSFVVVVVVMAMLQLTSTTDQDDNDMLGGHETPGRGDDDGFH